MQSHPLFLSISPGSHIFGLGVTIMHMGEVPFGGDLYSSYDQDIPRW